MTIASKLLDFLINPYTPEEVKMKCSLFRKSQLNEGEVEPIVKNIQQYNYDGFLIDGNSVKVYNIIIWDNNNWNIEEYLDISKLLIKLQEHYNLLHCFTILKYCLTKYYRENVLTENHILFFKYYDKRFKHKCTYEATKHRGRERKYIKSYRNANNTAWDRILYQSATKEVFNNHFGQYKRERPTSFFMDYQTEPEQLILQNRQNSSNGVQREHLPICDEGRRNDLHDL